jgi:PTS system mannose-specific IID component
MTGRWLRFRLLLRSFLIQGSWNYRTLIGAGVAWALLPVSRSPNPAEERGWPESEQPFNAHPYLVPMVLGALAHASGAGASPEQTRRFREALGSPLGSLGDRLVWGAWRPVCLLLGALGGALGGSPVMVVLVVVVTYNLLHIVLRVWALRVGLASGFEVGKALASARLPLVSERVETVGVIVFGCLLGVVAVEMLGLWTSGALWAVVPGALLCWAGIVQGDTLRRWAPALLFFLVALGLLLPIAGLPAGG